MVIMGIDPGSRITGYGLIRRETDSWSLLGHGCIRTQGAATFSEKLNQIYSGLMELVERFRPDAVVVERGFFGKNPRTALAMGQVLGISLLVAARASLPICEYSPREIKLAVTGFGSASKEQVQHMVKQLLQVDEDSLAPDASDALAAALCHANRVDL